MSANCADTNSITQEIKRFFDDRYSSRGFQVIYSTNPSEYMFDLVVSNFSPYTLVTKRNSRLLISARSPKVYLTLESELGGSGGGSQKKLQQNVVEDFAKLLISKSEKKIIVFTSLGYRDENNHPENRVENLYDLYARLNKDDSRVFAIHINGSKPNNQVTVLPVGTASFRFFEFLTSGYIEIQV